VVGAEVLNLVEAQGHARPSARAALYRMRRDGLVGAQQVGRSYLYSPVSGED
jgi:DNA-binding transcriptional regulator PaaX